MNATSLSGDVAGKQITDPSKIKTGQQINLPIKTLVTKVRNIESELFPDMTRSQEVKSFEKAFNLNEDDAIKAVQAVIQGAQTNFIAQSPALQKWLKSGLRLNIRSNASAQFTQQVFTPLLEKGLKANLYFYGGAATVITGGEAYGPAIELYTDKSIQGYIIANDIYNGFRQKAIIGIVQLAATMFGKDVIYSKQFWMLSDEFKDYKEIDPSKIPEAITKIAEKLSELFQKKN